MPQKADFTFYGGIYRDVTLHRSGRAFRPARKRRTGSEGDPIVTDLAAKTVEVTVEAAVVGAQSVTFALEGQALAAPVENGTAKAVFTWTMPTCGMVLMTPSSIPYLRNWTTARKHLPALAAGNLRLTPRRGFFLNGRSYPLRGVSRHQDRKGRAMP